MKILIPQLARLGDIYLSWPAIRALRRQYPDAEIHVLARPRFEGAFHGLEAVNRIRLLPTEDFLEPLTRAENSDHEAVGRVRYYLEQLRREKYDWIVNMTFSPLSSWLTAAIAGPDTRITGYTRHEDGWLRIADDVSAYFYAQGGIGRPSRIHLTDLFATMMDVNLQATDWRAPEGTKTHDYGLPTNYVVIHVAASRASKCPTPLHWGRLIRTLAESGSTAIPVLVGSKSETGIAGQILAHSGGTRVIDLTGQTEVSDLFGLIGGARAVVGGDSAPMHVASLMGTPCLNLSIGEVNFWETGPRSVGSRVMRSPRLEDLDAVAAGMTLAKMLSGQSGGGYQMIDACPCYEDGGLETGGFAWALVQALYLAMEFPTVEDMTFVEGAQKLRELNDGILEVIERLSPQDLGPIIDRGDELMEALEKAVPDLGVLTRWIRTEKTRIPPGETEQIRERMVHLHKQLRAVLRLYTLDERQPEASGGTV